MGCKSRPARIAAACGSMPESSKPWPTRSTLPCWPGCSPTLCLPSAGLLPRAGATSRSGAVEIAEDTAVASPVIAGVTTDATTLRGEPPITPDLVREHNLNELEYGRILDLLGRTPTFTELGVFSALWSEHCSYKHSRPVLKSFPTAGPQVIQGPGENAGVLRLPDGWAVAFKIESHNHPSAVEPYQGAATGVGGILRDVFTMGARPVAMLNSLRFGPLDHP